MTIDLDAIRTLMALASSPPPLDPISKLMILATSPPPTSAGNPCLALADEVPGLVAEVERLRAERDAAEGKVRPPGWRIDNGVYDRDVRGRDDLIYVRVYRGYPGSDGTWLRPFAQIAAADTVRIDADTILAAIEAAEAWLKEHAP